MPGPARSEFYSAVRAGQPITCVPIPANGGGSSGASSGGDPNNGGIITSSGGVPVAADAGAGGATAQADAGRPRVASNQKTLERQAVDYVALGEYQKAVGIYEQLSRQFPDNKVYSEALRILRQKLDAGTQ